jgi:hypothetical protein
MAVHYSKGGAQISDDGRAVARLTAFFSVVRASMGQRSLSTHPHKPIAPKERQRPHLHDQRRKVVPGVYSSDWSPHDPEIEFAAIP